MPASHPDRRTSLLPAGRRWGFGAHSVVPYLTHTQQARSQRAVHLEPAGEFNQNPVFVHMEHALRVLEPRS